MGRDLLVHCCCGPCSLEPIRLLREEGFEPVLCWTNPNIQPVAEHERRLATLRGWAEAEGLEVILGAEDRDGWESSAGALGAQGMVGASKAERRGRCGACYRLRLAEAARVAAEGGFSHLATTLAVSPYQHHHLCDSILEQEARARGLVPVVRDWRDRYGEATVRARKLGLYRQNYCGCRFSAAEAAMERAWRRHGHPVPAQP